MNFKKFAISAIAATFVLATIIPVLILGGNGHVGEYTTASPTVTYPNFDNNKLPGGDAFDSPSEGDDALSNEPSFMPSEPSIMPGGC